MSKLTIALLGVAITLAATAQAHHSFPVHYVPDEMISVTGTVKEFRYVNPHAVVFLEVKNASNANEMWKIEWNGAGSLRRRGILPDAMVSGDRVTIDGYPARDGSNAMRLNRVSFEDGRAAIGPPVRGTNNNED